MEGEGALSFAPLPPPAQQDVERLAEKIAARLGAIARKRLGGDQRLVEDDEAAMFAAAAEALRLPGIRPRQDGTDPRRLCASVDGFTLHAGRHVDAHDRDALERLLRYCLRPPFGAERFSQDGEGRVHYRLRKPWPGPGGSTDLVLDPLALLRRLACLVPRPYSKLIRIDALSCPRCAVPMVVLAFIIDPPVLRKILDHLGLPSSPPPVLPARNSWQDFPLDDHGGWLAEQQQTLPDLEVRFRDPPDSS